MFKLNYLTLTCVEVRRISDNRCVRTFNGATAKVDAKQFIADQNWSDTRSVAA